MKRQLIHLEGLGVEDRVSIARRVDAVLAKYDASSAIPLEIRASGSIWHGPVSGPGAVVRLACLSLATRLLRDNPMRVVVAQRVHQRFDEVVKTGESILEYARVGDEMASHVYACAVGAELQRRGIPCRVMESGTVLCMDPDHVS